MLRYTSTRKVQEKSLLLCSVSEPLLHTFLAEILMKPSNSPWLKEPSAPIALNLNCLFGLEQSQPPLNLQLDIRSRLSLQSTLQQFLSNDHALISKDLCEFTSPIALGL